MANKRYDINDERIARIDSILSRLPKLEKRIDEINAALFAGNITSAEFMKLTQERSVLVKKYDDLEREAAETYRIIDQKSRGNITIVSNNIE